MAENRLTVTVRGDSGTDYPLEIFLGRKLLHLKCGCRAGMAGSRCKHAADIFLGDFSRIMDENERSAAQELMATAGQNMTAIQDSDRRLAEIDSQIKILNEQKKKIKSELDAFFKLGFPLSGAPVQESPMPVIPAEENGKEPKQRQTLRQIKRQIDKLDQQLNDAIGNEQYTKAITLFGKAYELWPALYEEGDEVQRIIQGMLCDVETLQGLVKAYDKLATSPAIASFLTGAKAQMDFAEEAGDLFENEKVETKAQVKKLLAFLDSGHPIAGLLARYCQESVIRHLSYALEEITDSVFWEGDFPSVAAVRAELDKIL